MKLFKILSVLLLSLSVSSAYADKIQVGFVYVGPVGDHGWTYMHDQGRIMAEEHFGDDITTTYGSINSNFGNINALQGDATKSKV